MFDTSHKSFFFLKEFLQHLSGRTIALKINDNRSTMISLQDRGDVLALSLHRMFLGAPQDLLTTLASDIRRVPLRFSPSVRRYIEDTIPSLDYRQSRKSNPLPTKGEVYDLRAIYNELNERHFEKAFQLDIGWYGKQALSERTNLRFGLYHEPLKTIKVHRLLDRAIVPDFVVGFVIYHEMVHAACPPIVDEKGRMKVHHQGFLNLEKKYPHYESAKSWIQSHLHLFFTT